MSIEPLAIGVCSWSLQVTNVPELKASWIDSASTSSRSLAATRTTPRGMKATPCLLRRRPLGSK